MNVPVAAGAHSRRRPKRYKWGAARGRERGRRSQWQSAGSRDAKIAAASGFDSALSRLLVTVEAYPQLQATQAFRDLMTQLEGTENRIATARRDYNESVQSYNVLVARFPRNILARFFGFGPEKLFSSDAGADKAPAVNF